MTISAIYCPPRHTVSTEDYTMLFRSLGARFLIGGYWNAKHTAWGARLTTPKGRNLLHAIAGHNCHYLSTGEPTYWQTDLIKLLDLLDFIVTRSIIANYIQLESTFELSSNHTPVIATLSATTILKPPTPKLTTSHTNWDMFRAYINERLNLNLCIKKPAELDDATHYFTTLIQAAAWHSTPTPPARMEPTTNTPSIYANSSLQKGHVADGNAREIKAIGSRTTGLEDKYKPLYGTPKISPSNITLPPSPRVTTPFGRLHNDLNVLKHPYPPSGRRTGAGPKVTKKKPRHLRTTSNKCSHPTLSPSVPMMQSPPS